jgi:hypothetical protein
MSDNRNNMIIGFVIFLLLGGILTGMDTPQASTSNQTIHIECLEYMKDEDGDGQSGFIEDESCQNYPYQDGNGESKTLTFPDNPPYQTYYDLSVDFVRTFVMIECNGNLANCVGTNFESEWQFYCFFSGNIMTNDFGFIFNNFNNNWFNDGSSNYWLNTCGGFPPYPNSNLPDMGGQTTTPIPNNPTGSSNGGGAMK